MKLVLPITVFIAALCFSAGFVTVESSPEGLVIEFNSDEIRFGTIELSGKNYTTIRMDRAETLNDVSFPKLPVYRFWLEIPVDARVKVDIEEQRVETIEGTGFAVEPAVMSASKSEYRSDVTVEFDHDVYDNCRSFPSSWSRVVECGMMRGRNLALVEIMPLIWNPSSNNFNLLAEASIKVSFEGGDIAQSFYLADRYSSAPFERILSNQLINYGTFESNNYSENDLDSEAYLIVGHSDFTDSAMEDFVDHKEDLGFNVTMVDLATTGSSDSEIQAYILNAIENWPDPPSYVLLVGDTGYLPGYSATKYSGVTDLYYVTLDDGGYFPDAFIGRFSVQSETQCEIMVARVLDYEDTGPYAWVQNTCWIASNDNWNISQGTHDYCISNYLDPRDYTYDKVYPHEGGTAADAVSSINGGISMLTFSGHGSKTSWADMSFSQTNFNQLTNDDMFPGVLSHACLTGDYGYGTAWCETWTRTSGRGGLWFWGSVPSSYWDEDDIMEKGEYKSFLDDDVYYAMGFLNAGKLAVYNYYSGGGNSQRYYEAYNLMGDPSIVMKTWPNPDFLGITEEGHSPTARTGLAILITNPVMSSTFMTIRGAIGPASLEVFDLAGRIVACPFLGELINTASFTWNTSGLSTGVYFLRLTQGEDVEVVKVSLIR